MMMMLTFRLGDAAAISGVFGKNGISFQRCPV
jgi:hypothetical protein